MVRARPGPNSQLTAASIAAAVVLLALGLLVAVAPVKAQKASAASSIGSPGYWLASANGAVSNYGTANLGGLAGVHLTKPIVGGSATPDGFGYWLVATDGGVFSFGDAGFHGSTGGVALRQPIVGMATDPQTGGYWLVAADGGVFSFDAPFYGSTGGVALREPIVGIVVTPDGGGYWLVASDGGVFSFGDAQFYGSTGGIHLAKPIVGMAANPKGGGYWLVASDGGVFTFGNAGFYGSTGGVALDAPVEGLQATPDADGYWLVSSNGGVFTFGDAPFLGSEGNSPDPVVTMISTSNAYPFLPGQTGYDISNYQCSDIPPPASVAVVEIAGALNGAENSCYSEEAAWAGENLSTYIFMNPAPSGQNPYDYGYNQARYWVSVSKNQGVDPTLWWLDVEFAGGWTLTSAAQPASAEVIEGAVAGLRSDGKIPGIYATSLQWDDITGNTPSLPGIAIWEAGAYDVSSGPYNAVAMCTGTIADHTAFAGGTIVLVQYDWNDPGRTYDEDYACR